MKVIVTAVKRKRGLGLGEALTARVGRGNVNVHSGAGLLSRRHRSGLTPPLTKFRGKCHCFLRGHLNGGKVEGRRILSPQSVALMPTVTAHGRHLHVELGWRRNSQSRTLHRTTKTIEGPQCSLRTLRICARLQGSVTRKVRCGTLSNKPIAPKLEKLVEHKAGNCPSGRLVVWIEQRVKPST